MCQGGPGGEHPHHFMLSYNSCVSGGQKFSVREQGLASIHVFFSS